MRLRTLFIWEITIFVIGLSAVAVVSAKEKSSMYVPVSCITRLTVNSWGKCDQNGSFIRCPQADVQFTASCVSPKGGKQTSPSAMSFPSSAEVK